MIFGQQYFARGAGDDIANERLELEWENSASSPIC